MNLDNLKELDRVVYPECAVKLIDGYKIRTPGICCFATHWHDRIELLLIKKGSLVLNLHSEEHIINAGELAIIMPKEPHSAYSGKDGVEYAVLMFELSSFINNSPVSDKYIVPIENLTAKFDYKISDKDIVELIEKIISTLKETVTPKNSLTVTGSVYILLGMLFERHLYSYAPNNSIDERFTNVLDFINEHYTEPISSSILSLKFGYDEAYFCRKFSKITGLSPMQYIKILRLEKAKKLLSSSNNLTIGEIALLCGFSDMSYFTKCFRKHFEITPTSLKKEIINYKGELK